MPTSFTWALEFKLNVRHEDTAPHKGFASPGYQLAGGRAQLSSHAPELAAHFITVVSTPYYSCGKYN